MNTSTYRDEQKAFRWQLTSIVPSAADIVVLVDNADKKLFHSAFNPTHCLHHMLPPPKKLLTVDVYASKDMVVYYPWQKPSVIRTAFSSGVCIAMLSISQALCYSLHIRIHIIIV